MDVSTEAAREASGWSALCGVEWGPAKVICHLNVPTRKGRGLWLGTFPKTLLWAMLSLCPLRSQCEGQSSVLPSPQGLLPAFRGSPGQRRELTAFKLPRFHSEPFTGLPLLCEFWPILPQKQTRVCLLNRSQLWPHLSCSVVLSRQS